MPIDVRPFRGLLENHPQRNRRREEAARRLLASVDEYPKDRVHFSQLLGRLECHGVSDVSRAACGRSLGAALT